MATRNHSGAATVTLPSDREIVITRVFDAPAHLVFDAMTKPEHVKRWWGPRGTTLSVCEIDLRVGGKWHFVSRAEDGTEHGFHGEFREIVPPEWVVQTWVYEPMPDAETVETMTLVEKDGKTTMTTTVLHKSKENRDGHLSSGMEDGMQQTFDRLEELLASMR